MKLNKFLFILFIFILFSSYAEEDLKKLMSENKIIKRIKIKEIKNGQIEISDKFFKIIMPSKKIFPTAKTINQYNNEFDFIQFYCFDYESKSNLELFIYDFPESFNSYTTEADNDKISNLIEGMASVLNAEIINKKNIEFNGYDGVDLLLKVKESYGKETLYNFRLLFIKNRIYQLCIYNKIDEKKLPEVMEKYFNSFKIKK